MVVRLVLCVAGLVASSAIARAEQPVAAPVASAGDAKATGDTKGNTDWPSSDGKFAFLAAYGDLNTIDLVDPKSQKKLQRIAESDSTQTNWHVLWSPDSNRFALMTRFGHPIQGVDVYVRTADTFQKVDLPDLPDANIPERLKRGRKFPHVASTNWQEATEWKKDGSLVATIETMIDGAGSTITATRTVVLGFDRSGKAKIVKSTIKYKTETD
jgi:hypothetical protein